MFSIGENRYYWLDTPGHADFISEAARVLCVLDYAVLIVDITEGVQAHTETLWRMLAEAGLPVLLFANKTDRSGADYAACLAALRRELSP